MVVVPCTLCGAFMMKAAEGGIWESIKVVVLALTGLSQMCIMCAAAYYIEDAAQKRKDELALIPDDEEVLLEDQKVLERVAKLNEAVKFDTLGTAHKILLWTGM